MKTTIFSVARKAMMAVACASFVLGAIVMPQSAEAKKAKKIGIQLYSVMGAVQKAAMLPPCSYILTTIKLSRCP